MREFKFTPGPWMVNNSPGAGWEIRAAIPELKKYRSNDEGSVIWTVPEGTSITPVGEPKPLIGYEPWVQFPQKWWIEMTKCNANLIAAAPEMYEILKLYEEWEAELLMDNSAWVNGLPRFTQSLYDKWMEIQGRRNEVLVKVEGN